MEADGAGFGADERFRPVVLGVRLTGAMVVMEDPAGRGGSRASVGRDREVVAASTLALPPIG